MIYQEDMYIHETVAKLNGLKIKILSEAAKLCEVTFRPKARYNRDQTSSRI